MTKQITRSSLCGLLQKRPTHVPQEEAERTKQTRTKNALVIKAMNSHPYLRPLFSASNIFFTCCGLGSEQTDPFRSVPYILEDFTGIRDLTEFLWTDFL